jgi:hypothetical protein
MSVIEPVNKFSHLWVLSLLTALRLAKFLVTEPVDFDIFWCSPRSSASGGGRLSQGRKEKLVTRLRFRRARGQVKNEQAQPSLKAYRVEFVEPLTEHPGTENEKGNIKKYQHSPIDLRFSYTVNPQRKNHCN